MKAAFLSLFILTVITAASQPGQKRWSPYAGIHISGDAEMFYVGPSFQLGVDYRLNRILGLSSYVHYFGRNIDQTNDDGTFQKGNFRMFTGALLLQVNLGKRIKNRGMFIAAGAAIQPTVNDYRDSWSSS
jgi:hypothetical protein